jgi:hypothetical protein
VTLLAPFDQTFKVDDFLIVYISASAPENKLAENFVGVAKVEATYRLIKFNKKLTGVTLRIEREEQRKFKCFQAKFTKSTIDGIKFKHFYYTRKNEDSHFKK